MNEIDEVAVFIARRIAQLDENMPYSRMMLARLRRAVGKTPLDVPDVWEMTIPGFLAPTRQDNISDAEWVIHIILSLYAMHKQSSEGSVHKAGEPFGKAVAGLIQRDPLRRASVMRRFNALATSVEFSEMTQHARGIIQLLRQDSYSPLDYLDFARDLYRFRRGNASYIRLKWGRDFYRNSDIAISDATADTDDTNSDDENNEEE